MEYPLAIMFVDIADSTKLYEAVGNAKAAEMTRRTLFHLRSIVEANQGAVVKMLGDGLLSVFKSADSASTAAMAMVGTAPSGPGKLKLRVGLSFGKVIQQVEDVYGDSCNVAARLQAMARPNEILATDAFIAELAPAGRAHAKVLSRVSVKGKSEPILVYELKEQLPQDDDSCATIDATTVAPVKAGDYRETMALHLLYRRRSYTVDRVTPRLIVGRDDNCDIRLLSRNTSRHHAQLDFSRESFILTDQSTNGTFIRVGTAAPVALRRDATKLVGHGMIGFGAEPVSEDEDHVIGFRCEIR